MRNPPVIAQSTSLTLLSRDCNDSSRFSLLLVFPLPSAVRPSVRRDAPTPRHAILNNEWNGIGLDGT